MEDNVIKCIAVGDGFVGKTSLLTRLANKDYDQQNYVPTIFDNTSIEITHSNGKKYNLHLIDTAGQEAYVNLRTQAYENGNIFLLCFSVINVDSFSNIFQSWIPEVSQYKPDACFILIGTKGDLRTDPETIDRMNISQEFFVNKNTAENFAKSHGIKYIECSAVTKDGVEDVLKAIVDLHVWRVSKLQARCCNPFLLLIKRIWCCKYC